ncbi:IPT/TIG domain-containing protein [Mucilaginibacter celer]|uniref:T9SS C-terminal target domain-containing protein n=1 Tax=Mucilaginibacter celer TaxID=2305508 RepID=A0A494VQB9_9SPHI|nr:IPT/TIG domain-containing protein [Mucilaginibacter celer]AYL95430.1 T9SS C-terminal target domain-containing protein [Mucilaginibacter celer]
MYKSLLSAFILTLLFSAKLFAQKPVISYPAVQTLYLGKTITPISVTNTGGAVPNVYYPQVIQVNKCIGGVQYFVKAPSGDYYASSYGSILHIKPDGSYTKLAGNSGNYGYADGKGAAAFFGETGGITIDKDGNLYVTDLNMRDGENSRVRKITPDGVVSTYAQKLIAPSDIVIDPNGIIYVSEPTGRIMKIAKDGKTSVFAGKIGTGAADGLGTNASFNNPKGLAIDKSGNIYVADFANNMIRKITPAGQVTTLAGTTRAGSADGSGANASFNLPESIIIDSKGYITVGEKEGSLRRINPAGQVTTLPTPYYDDKGDIYPPPLTHMMIADENDDLIVFGSNGSINTGFYKISTAGYHVAPSLPAGLVLGPDGTITGTPTWLTLKNRYKISAANQSGVGAFLITLEVVLPPDPPVISSFSPAAGYPGMAINITGSYLSATTAVTIGGKPAGFTNISPTSVTAYVPEGTTSGDITLTTAKGTSRISGFTLIPPPAISSFSPTTGWKGAVITITGTGFSDATRVTFGGTNATFKVTSPTTIEAVATEGSSGAVSVTAPSGTGSLPGFTYISAPVISSVSPSFAAAGNTVTITGSNFSNATSVKFGSVAATSYTVVSPTTISAVVAAGSSNGVTVTTPGGSSTYNDFNFIPPPVITSISPSKGGNNSSIYIYGSNLGSAQVTIGGVAAAISSNYNEWIVAMVGAGATSGNVTVTTKGGTASLPGFIFVPAPQITSFTPQSGGAGDKVTITGTNLTEVDNVSFGGVSAAFNVLSSTTIEATVGSGASGDVRIASEGGSASLPGFTHSGPSITSFSPDNAGSGETVVIKGINFTGATSVDFGGVPATSFTITSPTEISAVVGAGKSGNVTVKTSKGSASLAGFKHPGPFIQAFNPTYSGPLATTPVTITGSNFGEATGVSFGGVPAISFTVVSATTITAIPATATTSGNVVVTTPKGTDSAPGFTWVQKPTISSFTPSSQKNGGTVTITGENFIGVTSVKFGGQPARYFYALSATSITANVGNGASGDVSVTTVGGTATMSGFSYTSPVITAISPVLAAAGQTVTITGTNLDVVQSVRFGSANAASFSIISPTKILAVVATGETGDVTVGSPLGDASIGGFTYLPPPFIYSFSPTEGGMGTPVTISGINLLTTSEVTIGGIPAIIVSVGNYQVTVKAGAGATGKISLKTIAGTAEFNGFTWYPAPAITSASPMKANAETTVTINGSNFTGVSQVKFGSSFADFTVVSPTVITAKPINGESGDITVITPGGTATLPGFIFIPAPVITSFTKTGDGSSALVTVTGSNFTDVTEVSFGGVAAKSFKVLSSTSITATPGAGATGAITVKAAGGIGTKRGFLFIDPPVITSFSPAFGPIGTTVTIKGDNFNPVADKNVVYFGPVKAQVKSAAKNHLEVIVPAGANKLITVTNTDKKLSASSNLQFIVTSDKGATSFSNKFVVKINGGFDIDDFDGDGTPDFLVNSGDSLYILKHGPDPLLSKSSFTQKLLIPTSRHVNSKVIGDVDGDGKKDILFSSGIIVFMHNTSTNGNVSFEEKVLEDLDGNYDKMELRDMNGDGRPDLIMYDSAFDFYYYPNTTNGSNVSFGPKMRLTESSSGTNISLAITDIDGDNKPDPIYGCSSAGIYLYENNSLPGDLSSNDFSVNYITGPVYNYTAWYTAIADFDGDGKADLAENDIFSEQFLVSRNVSENGIINGHSLEPPKAFSNASMVGYTEVGDMDGDGKMDLLGLSYDGVYYARNQSVKGNISMATPARLINIYDLSEKITLNDMDGDGRMDLIVFVIGSKNQLTIYHNGPVTETQITAVTPLAATTGTKVTITGKNFSGATVVNFGSKAAKSFTVESPESIAAIVGEGETGAISVQTPNGTATFAGFKFVLPPVITKAEASPNGNGKLVITGSNFTTATGVTIGGLAALSYTVDSDTKITATFAGVSGDLAVTTAGGTATLPAVTVKINQVITFDALATHTYGDADFALAATSSNNTIPVTYSVDNNSIASVTDGKIHILKAGTVTITASQAGDLLNNAAADVKRVLTISKKTLQVKALDQTRVFGKANPDLTASYDGFVNGENESNLTKAPIVGATATTQSPAGIYDLTVSGGLSDNYTFVYGAGKLMITQAANNLKVAANSVTCKGQNNGSVSITAEQTANYTAVITGNGINKNYTFTTATSISNLLPGTYNVCVTNAALPENKQCFDLVITEPKDLSVYTTVNKLNKVVNITLDGGAAYNIRLNGVNYQTTQSSITLPLNTGSNSLSVSTDKLCQGVIDQVINVAGIIPYPNPFQNTINVNIGQNVAAKATIRIYEINSGALKLTKDYFNQSGVLSIDVSSLGRGIYSLNLTIDGINSVYKIIKQ